MEWMLILVMGFGQQIETIPVAGFDSEAGCYRAGIELAEVMKKRRMKVAKEIGIEHLQSPQTSNTICTQIFTSAAMDPQSALNRKKF